jgi:hypothetical protein
MPDRLTDVEWYELLSERDAFKLTIRACAALEAEVDALATEMFRSPIPRGIKSIGSFNKRIRVAAAVGVVPPHLIAPMDKLWELRNDFAHGDILELTAEHVVPVEQSYRSIGLEDTPAAELLTLSTQPVHKLVVLLQLTRVMIQASAEIVRRERDDAMRNSVIRQAVISRLQASSIPSEEAVGTPTITQHNPPGEPHD